MSDKNLKNKKKNDMTNCGNAVDTKTSTTNSTGKKCKDGSCTNNSASDCN